MKVNFMHIDTLIIKNEAGDVVDRINMKSIDFKKCKTTGNKLIITEKAE